MGKKNRQRQAAKQKTQPKQSGFWTAQQQPSADDIGNVIITAAADTVRGNAGAAKACANELARTDELAPLLQRAAGLASQHIITRVFRNGWLPADIHEAARRNVDQFAGAYLLDVIAEYLLPFAPATVDETWRQQVGELGIVAWWSRSEPHLGQWAAKHILTAVETLTTVVEALALLISLPRLELIRPLPGTAVPRAPKHHNVDEKMLGRVRALLAKAESTGFPEEAEALSAKAQELMTRHALDRVLVEADTAAEDLPGARRLWLDTPYVDAKALLADVVARANRCKVIFSAWGFVTIVGDENDLDAVELLTTSLLVQATRAMVASGKQSSSRSRSYRQSFLVAYATRIGERLEKATETTIAESADAERLLPVLASHQAKVDKVFDTLFPTVRGKNVSFSNGEGWHAGRAAADRAQLDTRRPLRQRNTGGPP
ncbi:Protein of unknown function [Amycolatopsis xylanica]|uniref:Uncharacterized protein n=1 Tax=Amycolatopsis xylanica TaxID=589385 RepID=A0A1H3R084_9PSEU|nr:DUF2786 domain-containing protein [Amycolatopsis xylanica]SDZ19204.1 Protein of unknown function [Amycolatopsis xylanica]